MTDTTARDAKLIQYLNEAYAMEMHLETALQAHISMTTDNKYRQRLKEHLTETRRHGRELGRRVKKLGGTPETVPAPGPDVVSEAAGALLGGAEKAVALAQGPWHALRGSGPEEKQLKNAKTEYASEAREIATYYGIETLAHAVGDKDTVQLARTIRRDEERMRSFLEREIPRLTRAVVSAEIPASERRGATSKKRGSSSTTSGTARGGGATRGQSRGKTPRSTKRTSRSAKPSVSAKSARSGKPGRVARPARRAASTSGAKASSRRSGAARPKAASRAQGTARRSSK